VEAVFSSLGGGHRLRERVHQLLGEVTATAGSGPVDVHVTTFSFTDDAIAARLVDLAQRHPNVTVRIVADWSQGSCGGGRQVAHLARLGLPNLLVRYKHDQPYRWDAGEHRLRWSYHASRGLLHHKTLGVLLDGEPAMLLCGSYNWTEKASNSYENILLLAAKDPGSRGLMRSMEWEFEAMWSDGRVTLSPDEARIHYQKILAEYRNDPTTPAQSILGIGSGADDPLHAMAADRLEDAGGPVIAFSSRSPLQTAAESGYAPANRERRLELAKPGGTTKCVPLTLSTLALDVIARARPGDTLRIAMYGLSARIPEYGALLAAARRGVALQILLDGRVGQSMLRRLAVLRAQEDVPIECRGTSRMMHEKYILHAESDTVLTGTANLSTDASNRHSEQRLAIRACPTLTAAFLADFETIWARVSKPLTPVPA